ncbi:hypothetical protein GCM10010289_76870 [Streptomyces violascens]|uniref:Uncharacterized protein n=1 Tax=Streptomyces violascens TaxID=67381 RepID=A0ABQ3QL43_9ACTN|nr:hypothetical protein GCM10010289_76870 [Streptomyces violascens]GHI37990.1 hypothetical protein Sviol_23980 [Streptomyces violascens]
MDSATVVVTLVSIVTARGCGLLGLWLRLRAQARQEESQRRLMGAVVEIAAGGRLDLETSAADGQQVRLRGAPGAYGWGRGNA